MDQLFKVSYRAQRTKEVLLEKIKENKRLRKALQAALLVK